MSAVAAAWELDFDEGVRGDELFGLGVVGADAVNEDFARSARVRRLGSRGRGGGCGREHGDGERRLRSAAEGDHLAEAAAILAGAAGVFAERFLLDQQRGQVLDHLDWGAEDA